MNLTRTDIYRRFYWICRTLTAPKSFNRSNAFAVGHEYELNTNNLWKGDIQSGNLQVPQFFWSRRWEEAKFRQDAICKDFPLVFLSPGERQIINSKIDFNFSASVFEFTIMVFELQNRDRNTLGGNEGALRERETIWQDTENILLQILAAFKGKDDTAIYNLRIAGEALGLPDDPTTWTVPQEQQATAFLKTYLMRSNFDLSISSSIQPFDYQHNDILAGVAVNIAIDLQHDCFNGTFENRLC